LSLLDSTWSCLVAGLIKYEKAHKFQDRIATSVEALRYADGHGLREILCVHGQPSARRLSYELQESDASAIPEVRDVLKFRPLPNSGKALADGVARPGGTLDDQRALIDRA
jgi:hypothetical protein